MELQVNNYKYQLTSDLDYIIKKYQIPKYLQVRLESLKKKAKYGGKNIIYKLQDLIKEYPHVPHLKNYLMAAMEKSGNLQQAMEINNNLLTDFPDYIFGHVNMALFSISQGQPQNVPSVLGPSLQLKELFPERELFHEAEFIGYNSAVIRYYLALGNIEAAEERLAFVEHYLPDHPDLKDIKKKIFAERMKTGLEWFKKEEERKIRFKKEQQLTYEQIKLEPVFTNQKINWLYQNGLRIDREKLEIVLSLPRQSLVADLEEMLKDGMRRYNYYCEKEKKEGYDENTFTFMVHAIYLLGELRSDKSLSLILETFKQGEDFIDFWFGDFITDAFYEPLYFLSFENPEKLKDFILRPFTYTYARTEASQSLLQIALHHTEKRDHIIEIFRDILKTHINAGLEDGLVDSDFLGLFISDLVNLRAPELLPEIKALFDLGYVTEGICGTYESVEEDISEIPFDYAKRDLINIVDRYEHIINTWSGYIEDEFEKEDAGYFYDGDKNVDEDNEYYGSPIISEPKTGRNDPCPCGSGKKYKKCCMV